MGAEDGREARWPRTGSAGKTESEPGKEIYQDESYKIQLNNRELATVLAALRLFQSEADYDGDAVYSMVQLSEHKTARQR